MGELELKCAIQNCRHEGPSQEDQETVWFHAAMQPLSSPVSSLLPLDRLNNSSIPSEIQSVVTETINSTCLIAKLELNHFGALAVDVWVNQNMLYVIQFLIKGLVLKSSQREGPQGTLTGTKCLAASFGARFLPLERDRREEKYKQQGRSRLPL